MDTQPVEARPALEDTLETDLAARFKLLEDIAETATLLQQHNNMGAGVEQKIQQLTDVLAQQVVRLGQLTRNIENARIVQDAIKNKAPGTTLI